MSDYCARLCIVLSDYCVRLCIVLSDYIMCDSGSDADEKEELLIVLGLHEASMTSSRSAPVKVTDFLRHETPWRKLLRQHRDSTYQYFLKCSVSCFNNLCLLTRSYLFNNVVTMVICTCHEFRKSPHSCYFFTMVGKKQTTAPGVASYQFKYSWVQKRCLITDGCGNLIFNV